MTEVSMAHIERARGNVARWATYFEQNKLTPSFYSLTIGMPYRREIQCDNAAEEQNLRRGLPGYTEFRTQFYATYDMYSGENLIAVAAHQAGRETIENFPPENTPEYTALLKMMDRFGKRIKELVELEGPHSADRLALELYKKSIGMKE